MVYCFGHLALALDETRLGLAVGLGLVAIGSGGIKPCVSANVGDQFGQSNRHLLEKVFGWFYFSINAGSMFSTVLIPWLLTTYGPHVAFAVPGVLMFVATVSFWLGRHKFVHIPPGGWDVLRKAFRAEGLSALARLGALYAFVAIFWSLYDQTSSAWILQAKSMDRTMFGFTPDAAQTHTLNPVLILLFMPLFEYAIYPAINKIFPLTAVQDFHRLFYHGIVVRRVGPDRELDHRWGATPLCLAGAGLCDHDRSRSHGLDHLPGVFVHASPAQDEIAADGC